MVPPAPPPPPGEQVAESAAPSPDAHRLLPTPFLTKTYQLVDDQAIDDIISWNEDGSTFVVWRPAEFACDLLPKYFKHNNFSSFVRQLNTYGFRKIVPDRWEFANDCFRRGDKRLLCDIHRRKIAPSSAVPAVRTAIPANRFGSPTNSGDEQVLSSNSSPGAAAPSTSGRGSGDSSGELVEENQRLKKENERLNHELSQMKNLCNNILLLMSKYANQKQKHHDESGGGGSIGAAEKFSPPLPMLELTPLGRCSNWSEPAGPHRENRVKAEEEPSLSQRLFGVAIGVRRARSDEEAAAAAEETLHQPQLRRFKEAKSEPLDPSTLDREEAQDHRCRLYISCRPPNQRVCN